MDKTLIPYLKGESGRLRKHIEFWMASTDKTSSAPLEKWEDWLQYKVRKEERSHIPLL